jgi:hypothetical protein
MSRETECHTPHLFKEVQRLGTSILASAGVVGIIFGFAAQKTSPTGLRVSNLR